MSEIVPADRIEQIVGARRHEHQHLGRADSTAETVYVLHSQRCKDSGIDLRDCEFSQALDRGIDPFMWENRMDRPVVLAIFRERLFPVLPKLLSTYLLRPTIDTDQENP